MVSFGAYAPLMIHPASHVFIGFGPTFSHDLVRAADRVGPDNLATTIGAGLLVGGWL